MKKLFVFLFVLVGGVQGASAGYTALAERCLEEGQDMEMNRTYSFHVDLKRQKGILVAIDTDKLTEVFEGTIEVKGHITKFSSAEISAQFTKYKDDAGGEAIIGNKKRFCDFSQ